MDTEIANTEIEFKFLVSDKVIAQLPAIIAQFAAKVIDKPTKTLKNAYFDTAARKLRHYDIGLRTRQSIIAATEQDEAICQGEQTVKLAGQVIGGLHQRPEYNLPLTANHPDLTLFDASIWPDGMDVKAVNEQIYPIFATDFERQSWLLETASGSQIELVLDQGTISADKLTTPICEVEMELVRGDKSELFEFARQLVNCSEVRLGFLSKAARGYMLADSQPLTADKKLGYVRVKRGFSFERALTACLQHGIEFIQKHEQCYFEQPKLSTLKRILDGVSLLRRSFDLFADIMADEQTGQLKHELDWLLAQLSWIETAVQLKNYSSKKHAYYKKINKVPHLAKLIDELKQQHPDEQQVAELFHSSRYNQLLLDLTVFLLERSWRFGLTEQQQELASKKIAKIAKTLFEQDWQTIQQLMAQNSALSASDYIERHDRLEQILLSGSCLGALFDAEARDEFRTPWTDIIYGIEELHTLAYLQQLCMKQHEPETVDIEHWLTQKSKNVLAAMEHSRQAAYDLTPYWK